MSADAGEPPGPSSRMSHAPQQTLFDDTTIAPRIDASAFERCSRHPLDEHSWITHVPDLVLGHQQLADQLASDAPWEGRQRWMYNRMVNEPRLTAESTELDSAPAFLVCLAQMLSAQLGIPYDGVWMNWYRNHHDSTGWHADRPANKPDTATVPVLTLGAQRRFLIRSNRGGKSAALTPAGGDLILMQGRCQRDWQHSVPKRQAPTGSRISLNFSSHTQE